MAAKGRRAPAGHSGSPSHHPDRKMTFPNVLHSNWQLINALAPGFWGRISAFNFTHLSSADWKKN